MTTLKQHRRHAHLTLAAVLSAAALAALTLHRFPPEQYSFYPRCPIYALTGWQCPGCGLTRALAALLRGNLAAAMHLNPLILPLLLAALWSGCSAYRRALNGQPPAWPAISHARLATALVALTIFTLHRNLH